MIMHRFYLFSLRNLKKYKIDERWYINSLSLSLSLHLLQHWIYLDACVKLSFMLSTVYSFFYPSFFFSFSHLGTKKRFSLDCHEREWQPKKSCAVRKVKKGEKKNSGFEENLCAFLVVKWRCNDYFIPHFAAQRLNNNLGSPQREISPSLTWLCTVITLFSCEIIGNTRLMKDDT